MFKKILQNTHIFHTSKLINEKCLLREFKYSYKFTPKVSDTRVWANYSHLQRKKDQFPLTTDFNTATLKNPCQCWAQDMSQFQEWSD